MRYIIIIGFLLILSGCREEIINPSNSGGNINEPLLSNNSDIYSFSLNAQNITQSIANYSDLTSYFNQLFLSVSDYQSGSISIRVLSTDNEIIYQNILAGNEAGLYTHLNGDIPRRIEIDLNNFTARFKFEISPSQ